jgi:two-component system phosphate regulon sensor histidine kinase PhoR
LPGNNGRFVGSKPVDQPVGRGVLGLNFRFAKITGINQVRSDEIEEAIGVIAGGVGTEIGPLNTPLTFSDGIVIKILLMDGHIAAPARQTILFLLMLALPCLVLATLGLRLSRQERQLAEKRALDERQRKLTQFRLNLVTELERVKRFAVAGRPYDAAALVARVRDGNVVLPWDAGSQISAVRTHLETATFGDAARAGEREELASHNFDMAARHYHNAIAAAHDAWERAYGSVLLARVENKAGHKADARRRYRAVAGCPAEIQDEYGVPLALYAAEALLGLGDERDVPELVLGHLKTALPQLTPAALTMMRDVANKASNRDVIGTLERQIRDRDQAESIERDFPRLLPRLQSDEPVWVAYGDPLWLISLANVTEREPILVAVRAEGLTSGNRDVHLAGGKRGEPLGETFPGLRAEVTVTPEGDGALGRIFLTLALVFVVGLTLVAGFLLWRDLRRSARVAEMRSHFISSVSHELRTPLTSIRMFAESMRMEDEMDPETRAEYLDTILRESERLSRLVDNVLQFARVEQGRAAYQKRSVDVAGVLDGALRTFEPLAAQAGFEIDLQKPPVLPCLVADRDALEQAILNLLSNAIKYSGTCRRISVKIVDEGTHAAIRVIDGGVGIAPEEQRRIFERFYRAEAIENRQIPGAGLGLTLVKHIAEAHGGSISVESQPGTGSTFTLRIPFAAHEVKARQTPSEVV